MKRKIIAVVFLALLLIGIAYVRALFSHQARSGALSPEISKSVPAGIIDDYLVKEQATRFLDSLKKVYSDSLTTLETAQAGVPDNSSQASADSLQDLIGQLKDQLSSAEDNLKQARIREKEQFDRLILAFYNGEVSMLPADLSDYERKVSIKEIKNKAQDYFGLEEKTLDRIIEAPAGSENIESEDSVGTSNANDDGETK